MKYVIYIEGLSREMLVDGLNEKDALAIAWNNLTNQEQDAVRGMEVIEEIS